MRLGERAQPLAAGRGCHSRYAIESDSGCPRFGFQRVSAECEFLTRTILGPRLSSRGTPNSPRHKE